MQMRQLALGSQRVMLLLALRHELTPKEGEGILEGHLLHPELHGHYSPNCETKSCGCWGCSQEPYHQSKSCVRRSAKPHCVGIQIDHKTMVMLRRMTAFVPQG